MKDDDVGGGCECFDHERRCVAFNDETRSDENQTAFSGDGLLDQIVRGSRAAPFDCEFHVSSVGVDCVQPDLIVGRRCSAAGVVPAVAVATTLTPRPSVEPERAVLAIVAMCCS